MTVAVGLIAASLVIITNLVTVCLAFFEKLMNEWVLAVALISPILTICIYSVLMYILCFVSKQRNFRLLLSLTIFLQVLLLLFILLNKIYVIPSHFYIISIIITGLFLMGLYLWFFIMLSNTNENEVKAIKYLKTYAITYLILVVLSFIVSFMVAILKHESIGNDKLILVLYQLIDLIPYAYLTFFFFKHLEPTAQPK